MADLSIGTTIGGFAAYHAGNYFPDKTTVGLGSVNNWGASDSYTTASSTTYATSAAVKAAYDAAMAAVAALGSPAWGSITGKPATYAPSAHTHTPAQVGAMADGGVYGTATFSNWIRTSGKTGWYNETYGGGMHMLDTSWVRVSNGKALYCAGEGAFAGNVTAYYSDERLKEVDEDLDPDQCLAAVNRWRKVRYHANELGAQNGYDPKKKEIGLLAGEVHQDFPELTPLAPFDFETLEDGSVVSKSGENYRTMTYERVVAVQAAAITALTRRLEKLEAKHDG